MNPPSLARVSITWSGAGPFARRVVPGLARLDPVFRGSPLATAIACLAFGAMAFGAVWTIRTKALVPRLLLVAGALVWPLPDHPLQGPVIVRLSYLHGVHLADLLSLVALVLAVWPFHDRRPTRQS